MARPEHTVITYTGSVRNGAAILERWQWSVRTPRHSNNTPALLATTATAWAGFYSTHLRPKFAPRTVCEKVRVAHVGLDGLVQKDPDGAYLQGDAVGDMPGTGAGSGQFYPLQTALVASLTTARSGPTGKGRIFLPWPDTLAIQQNCQLLPADALAMANAVKGFLNAAAASAQVHVVSSKGYTSRVTGVRVGVAPDTQRSRRGDVPETYQAVLL